MQLIGGLIFALLEAIFRWISPWPLKIVFDSVFFNKKLPSYANWLSNNKSQRLVELFVVMILLAVFLSFFSYLSGRLIALAGQKVVLDIRLSLFSHIQKQSQKFHQMHRSGDLVARLGGDVQSVQAGVVNALPTVINSSLTVVGMVVIMFFMNWKFALVITIIFVVIAFLIFRYMAQIRTYQVASKYESGISSAKASEVLNGISTVQALGTEGLEWSNYSTHATASLEAGKSSALAQAQLTPIVNFAMAAGSAIIVYYGAQLVLSAQLTPGDILVFTAYLKGMYTPARQLSKLAQVIGRGQAAAARIFEILNTHMEIPITGPGIVRPIVGEKIVFQDVSFSYADRVVLDKINLEIPKGSKIALIGPTGVGKSTLMKLLLRFVDPTSGTIFIDGIDIEEFSLENLRSAISLVSQENYMFPATIWENIIYGSNLKGVEGALYAAKQAGVDDVISGFDSGYMTMVKERGASLSGGQRQCVALARAAARNSPILLFDEPTTGLDAELETVVLQAIKKISKNRTTLMVSHQLNAVKMMEKTFLIQNGNLIPVSSNDLNIENFANLVGRSYEFDRKQNIAYASNPVKIIPRPIELGNSQVFHN